MNRNGTEKKKCRWTVEITECAPLCSQKEKGDYHTETLSFTCQMANA